MPPYLQRARSTPKGGTLLWWVLTLLLNFGTWPPAHGEAAAGEEEAAALLTIRSGFTNGETVLADWNSANGSPCASEWTGIGACDNGRVQVLSLDNKGLTGTITTEGWIQLQALKLLGLGSNFLTGSLSSDWVLADTITSIDLTSNSIGGTLPAGIRFPASLQYLFLSNNTFQGTIPAWKLPGSLLELTLYMNHLKGPYPQELFLPHGLQTLSLFNNSLTGSLSADSAFPSSLQFLDLSNNQFEGTIPKNWTLPVSLQNLYLHNNPLLTGSIPQDWNLPDTLVELQLQNCNFTGQLPTGLKLPSGLQTLQLFNNALTGTIPAGWALPNSLKTLTLHSNKLTGTLPAAWELASELQDLELSVNFLTGTIPSNFTLHSKLRTLLIDRNQLTGTVPRDWKLPKTLQVFHLFGNQLEGTLDPAWDLPQSLTDLQVQGNDLSGILPAWNLPNLVQASFVLCNFTGPLPSYLTPQNAIVAVEPQSGSGFCGEVPSTPPYYLDDASSPTGFNRLLNGSLPNCSQDTPPRYTYPPASTSPPTSTPSYVSPIPPPSPSPIPSPPPSPDNATSGRGNRATGIAVGVAVAVISVVMAFLVLWWIRRRRRRAKASIDRSSKAGSRVEVEGISGGSDSKEKGELEREPLEIPLAPVVLKRGTGEEHALASNTGSELDFQQDAALALSLAVNAAVGSSGMPSQQEENRRRLDRSGLRNWVVDFKTLDINYKQPIGEGSFGRVYFAKWQRTHVAVKILVGTALDAANNKAAQRALTLSNPVLENLQKEAVLLCKLRHPNIVTFMGVCPYPPCVVTEYCERGSLADVLEKAKQSPSLAAKVGWLRRLSMMLDTAKGMLYLHSHSPPIIHRDLKSHNLLVDSHWRCKITDFNLSKILEDHTGHGGSKSSVQGVTNPRWLAPEMLEGQPASPKSDVYSFGIVLWEVLTWDLPFREYQHFQLIKHVLAHGRPSLPPLRELRGNEAGQLRGLDVYVGLMERCWSQAPDQRPSFQEVADAIGDMMAKARAAGAS